MSKIIWNMILMSDKPMPEHLREMSDEEVQEIKNEMAYDIACHHPEMIGLILKYRDELLKQKAEKLLKEIRTIKKVR